MNDIATVDERAVTEEPQSEATGMVQMIERLARSSEVDVTKLEKLLDMQERVMKRNAEVAYNQALAEMQPQLPIISERGEILNKQGTVQSKYALWEDINEAIRPILHGHGFALSFRTGREDGHIVVTGVLSHREGHSEQTSIYLPADDSGSKNAVQGVGSSISYGKRYTAQALLNLTSRGEDDDAVSHGIQPISAEQKERIIELLKETGADTRKFLAYMDVPESGSVDQIRAKDFNKAVQALEKKKAKAHADT